MLNWMPLAVQRFVDLSIRVRDSGGWNFVASMPPNSMEARPLEVAALLRSKAKTGASRVGSRDSKKVGFVSRIVALRMDQDQLRSRW